MTETNHAIQPGDIVADMEPGELVEVHQITPFRSRFLVERVGTPSRKLIKRPATRRGVIL